MLADFVKRDMNPRKVLFIAYHFPPEAAVGASRPAKFVKYLSELGWEPIVLTIREEHILMSDFERLKDVEHVPTVRARVWPTVLQLALKVRDAWMRNAQIGGEGGSASLIINPQGDAVRGDARSKIISSLTQYLGSLFEFPDKQIGWLIPALWKAYGLIRKHDIRLVVTTSPPQTTALVGLALSYLTQITLFTDLRDPWFRPIWESPASQAFYSKGILGWLEKKIMGRSARVITTTEQYQSYLRSFYTDLPESKFHTICNGYDGDDFRPFDMMQPNGKFTISYLGTFYLARSPKSFLDALSALIKERGLDKSELEVRFIGDVRYAEGESVEDMIKRYDLSSCVRISDSVPHKDALIAMKQSHVLLLFAPHQYYCIPAKAFEYIGSRRRILCFSKDGATADLVRQTDSGIVVEPDDIQQIKSAILRVYTQYKQGPANAFSDDIDKFTRRALTAKLAQLLQESVELRRRYPYFDETA